MRYKLFSTRDNRRGFTVTELVISATLAGILGVILFTATFYYYVNVAQSEATTDLALESQSILAQLTEDIRLADSVASTNAIADPNAPGGGWATSDPSNIIIIESPAVTPDRQIIYNQGTGFPYSNEFIFFLSGNKMYKRILANSAASGNTARTSCPAQLATAACPADRLFSSNASNLSFTFYNAEGASTSNAAEARSVVLNVDMSKKVFGKNITLKNSTRVTLRNK